MFGRWLTTRFWSFFRSSNNPWPDLPVDGFVSGRPATAQDVKEGRAVFHQEANGRVSVDSFPIAIPQYGSLHQENGVPLPGVVVQAERHVTETGSSLLFGFRTFEGGTVVATAEDIRLLGQRYRRIKKRGQSPR